MIQAGLYAAGADPLLDEAVLLWNDLDGFIGSVTRGQTDLDNFVRLQLAKAPINACIP